MTDLDGRLGARQIQGDRDYQEDDFGISHVHMEGEEGEHILLVLADGMGGHVAGAKASAISVRRFVEAFEEIDGSVAQRLRFALDAANNEITEAIKAKPEWDGMGCTLVGVSITDAGVQWVSVGDSPLWSFDNGKLERLNADHSMAPVIANLLEAGHLTEEEAANDKRKNALRSAVMGEEMELVDLKEEPSAIRSQTRIIVASDGLETLDVKEITAILKDNAKNTARETVAALIAGVETKAKPGQDNTTVLLFEPGGLLAGDQTSMEPEEVKSIVRRAKGIRKGGAEPDPQTMPGAKSETSRSSGMMVVIALLLAALAAALAWIIYLEPNRQEKEPDRQEKEAVTPPASRGEELPEDQPPATQQAEEEEEPPTPQPIEPEPSPEPDAPAPETEIPASEIIPDEESPSEFTEEPGESPALAPSGGPAGGEQPSGEDEPVVDESGEGGGVSPAGQAESEKNEPTTKEAEEPKATTEKKKKDEEEEEKPPPPPY